MISRRHSLSGATAVALSAVPMAASEQPAGLQIMVVRDADGTPVANAQVTIDNPEVGVSRKLTTDAAGGIRTLGTGFTATTVCANHRRPSCL